MRKNYFDNYESPNIVILPTITFCGASLTVQKQDAGQITAVTDTMCANRTADTSREGVTKPSTTSANGHLNKAIVQESKNAIKANSSWATNYLHSIAQCSDTELIKKRPHLITNTPVTLNKENIRNNNKTTVNALKAHESLSINKTCQILKAYKNPEKKFVIPKIKKYGNNLNICHESKSVTTSVTTLENQDNSNYNKNQNFLNSQVLNSIVVKTNSIPYSEINFTNNIKKVCEVKPTVVELTKNSTTTKLDEHEPKNKTQKLNTSMKIRNNEPKDEIQKHEKGDSIKKENIRNKCNKILTLKRSYDEIEEKQKLTFSTKPSKNNIINQNSKQKKQTDVTNKKDLETKASNKDKTRKRLKTCDDVRPANNNVTINNKITECSNKHLPQNNPEKDFKYPRKDLQKSKSTDSISSYKIKHVKERKLNKSINSLIHNVKLCKGKNCLKCKSNQSKDFNVKCNRKEEIFKRYREELYEKRKKKKSMNQHNDMSVKINSKNVKKDITEESVKTKNSEQPPRSQKNKNINVVINIFYKSPKDNNSESSELIRNCQPINDEFSFLDDFNVDEIVESLNTCEREVTSIDPDLSHMMPSANISNDALKIVTEDLKVKVNEINKMKTDSCDLKAEDIMNILNKGLSATEAVLTKSIYNEKKKQDTECMNTDANCQNTYEKIIVHEPLNNVNVACENVVLKNECIIINLSDDISEDIKKAQEANYSQHKNNEENNMQEVISKDNDTTSIATEAVITKSVYDENKKQDREFMNTNANCENTYKKTIVPQTLNNVNVACENVLKNECIIIDLSDDISEDIKKAQEANYSQHKNNEENNTQEVISKDNDTTSIEIIDLTTEVKNELKTLVLQFEQVEDKTIKNTAPEKETIITECKLENQSDTHLNENVIKQESNINNTSVSKNASKKDCETETKKAVEGTETKKAEKDTETKKAVKGTETKKAEIGTETKKAEKGTETKKAEKGTETKKAEKDTETKKAEKGTETKKAEKDRETKKTEKDTETKKAEKETETKKTEKANDNTNLKNKRVNSSDYNEKSKTVDNLPDLYTKNLMKKMESGMFNFFGLRYSVMSIIRSGRHSKVFLCKNANGKNFAVKSLQNINGKLLTMYDAVMRLQKTIPKNNLCIVYFLNKFLINGGRWCFLMEYYPKTLQDTLREHKNPFHINTVRILGKQLISAVLMLRNNSIIHLDIKPNHILLNHTNDKLKLCGFDKSCYNDCIIYLPENVTAKYRAPEIILGYQIGYGVDVWATALVLYEMATNKTLFPGIWDNDILFKQQCTLGNIPSDMIERSAFKYKHFYDGQFLRQQHGKGIGARTSTVTRFIKNGKLETTIFEAYHNYWGVCADKYQNRKDLDMVTAFHSLLEQMLELHPLYRIPIEFVYANPFIYEA